MTYKSKILGLAMAASVFGASSVFAAPIATLNFTYVGSISNADYAAWEAANQPSDGSAPTNVPYTTVLSNPLAASNSGYISEYDITATFSGFAANEHWSNLGFNITTTGGVTAKTTSGDDGGTEFLYTADTASPKVWSTNGDLGSNTNDLQGIAVIVTKANANKNLGVSTQWGGPNLSLGFVAVQNNGNGGTLSATATAGAYLGTYTGQTSTTTGTATTYTTSTSTFAPAAVTFLGAGPSAVYNYAYDAGTVATTLGGSSAGSLGISSPAPGYYTNSPVLSGLTSAKGYVTLTTTDTGTNINKLGIGAETPVFVLIDYNLGTTSLATLEADLTAVGGSQTASIFTSAQDTTGQFAKLQAIYGTTLFPSASSLLFELTGATTSTPNFGWDLTGSGVTVANVVAVPEPASIGLLALGALGLIGRRRSSK